MTIQMLEKKLKSVELHPKHAPENRYFLWLVQHYPPKPITNRRNHELFSKLLGVIITELERLETTDAELREGLSKYARMIAELVEYYERAHYPMKATGRDILEFLMEQHGLSQADLSEELGGQSVVSEIVTGKRTLNVAQIEKLAQRFHISPACFFSAK